MTEFEKKKRILALFDVDGTLTVPRGVSYFFLFFFL
jgi:phosphoserine phosphatase